MSFIPKVEQVLKKKKKKKKKSVFLLTAVLVTVAESRKYSSVRQQMSRYAIRTLRYIRK
jgi:hypothetical protein